MFNMIVDWYLNVAAIGSAWLQESPTVYYLIMLSGAAAGFLVRDFLAVMEEKTKENRKKEQ